MSGAAVADRGRPALVRAARAVLIPPMPRLSDWVGLAAVNALFLSMPVFIAATGGPGGPLAGLARITPRVLAEPAMFLVLVGTFGAPGAIIAGAAAASAARAGRAIREGRRMLPRMPAGTPEERAARACLGARLASGGRRPIDAASWDGPRLILLDMDLPDLSGCGDLYEPVEVAASRRTRRLSGEALAAQTRATAATGLLFAGGVAAFFWVMAGWMVAALFMLGVGLTVLAVGAVGRALRSADEPVRPIKFASTIATPGRVEHLSFGRLSVCTTADSVMVVEPGSERGPVLVTITHRSGRQLRLRYSGADHPALADLLARWIAAA